MVAMKKMEQLPALAAPMEISAMARKHWLTLLLFSSGLLFQLVVLPRSFPTSHYDVLGVERNASIGRVEEAYKRLSAEWMSDASHTTTTEFLKINYAYELLTNAVTKRNYDFFAVDDHLDVLSRLLQEYKEEQISKINLPLLSSVSTTDFAFNVLNHENFLAAVQKDYPLLIQVYSKGSPLCAQFVDSWKRIDHLFDGLADTGMVELGDVPLAAHLAEKKFPRRPFFRHGIPAIVAYSASCRSANCYMRYKGPLDAGAIVDWMATYVLSLPRILYYSKEMLGPNFVAKSGYHKVKVIFFSSTGERATPFLRQVAKQYSSYASFAFVFWKEEEAKDWWKMLKVESAPAFVFLKGPGVDPVVFHGTYGPSDFSKIMEEHKLQHLPHLRSDTSMKLGCDAKGYSLAGYDRMIWYCALAVGRHGGELSTLRETVSMARDKLVADIDSYNAGVVAPFELSLAATAYKEKRLNFAWLDGEVQKKLCMFYLASDYGGTCGPKSVSDAVDIPRLLIVRFQRNSSRDAFVAEKKNNLWASLRGSTDEPNNYASQLVARYNGSDDIQEIIKWISETIKDGDAREIPYFTQKVPDLVPTSTNDDLLKGSAGIGLKQKIQNILEIFGDFLTDPRIGPIFILLACLSFGITSLKNSRPSSQPTKKDEVPSDKCGRRRARVSGSSTTPTESITDYAPTDAQNLISSGSDSD